MPLAPLIRDRPMGSVAQVVRAGRHPSPRAAAQPHGDAPSFQLTDRGAEALATSRSPRSEWALTALAGRQDDDARHLADLLGRLVADIDAAGSPRRGVRSPVAG